MFFGFAPSYAAIWPVNHNRRCLAANFGKFVLGMRYRISFAAEMLHRKVMIVRVEQLYKERAALDFGGHCLH